MNPSAQPVTQNELNNLKRYLDTVWNALGIDIGFSKHFVDRVNDARNGKQITIGELQKIYTDVYMKWGKQILGLGKTLKGADEIEAILTKLSTNINIPFVIRWNRRTSMLDLHGITVMRKPNFRPNKPGEKQFKVESKVMLNNTPQSLTEAVKQIREKTERNNAIQQFVLEAFDVQFYNQLSWEQKQVFESVVAEVKELSEEELDELSKATLGSYIKKAHVQGGNADYAAGQADAKASNSEPGETRKLHMKRSADKTLKSDKRRAGINRATDKLTKEENEETVSEQYKIRIVNNRTKQVFETKLYESLEQAETQKYRLGQKYPSGHTLTIVPVNESSLDELSKKTLGSYIKKATDKVSGNAYRAGEMAGKKADFKDIHGPKGPASKVVKRAKGIAKATDKLTKEETVDEEEVNERIEDQHHALRSDLHRSEIKVSDGHADIHGAVTALAKYHKKNGTAAQHHLREEEEVSELSKSTLGSYIKKASFAKNRALKRMDSPKSPEQYSDASKEYDKRSTGLKKAQKEDVDENTSDMKKAQAMKRSHDRGLKNKKAASEPKNWKTTTVSDFLKRRKESVKEDSSFLE